MGNQGIMVDDTPELATATNREKKAYNGNKSLFHESQAVMNSRPWDPYGLAVGQAMKIDSQSYRSSEEISEVKLKQK